MIKIRVEGLPNEVEAYIKHMENDDKVNVLEVSKQFPNKGTSKLVRVYISIEYNKI